MTIAPGHAGVPDIVRAGSSTCVTVVLITCDQEWNVCRLVRSVLDDPSTVEREIVLVDSASTDSTVALALEYPISVVRLRPGQPLTAAAGRYLGHLRGTGDATLFLDGDMEL